MTIEDLMKKAIDFHGHSCPGLAIGVLASKYILDRGNDFSIDEELVAVVENDNCSVDAIQSLLGTTYGKGNLIFLDYGKNNYTFYNRTNQKAIKLILNPNAFGDEKLPREERLEKILNSKPEDIFQIKEMGYNPPPMAKIHDSVACDNCNEPTMSTRIRELKGKKLCIPCFKALKNK